MADPEGHLANFRYTASKDGRVLIYWTNRLVKILTGNDAVQFLAKADQADQAGQQLLMARSTGNFKRGNERLNKSHN